MQRPALAICVLLALGVSSSCTNDYDKFDLTGSPDGGGNGGTTTGGAAGSSASGGGGSSGATGGVGGGTGGVGAAGGVGGSSGTCGSGMKPCGSNCVPDNDPATGCAAASCDPCTIANGTPTCAAGACAIASCNGAFGDCNGNVGDGCELNLSSPNNNHCGGCNNDCTQQGWTTHFSCGSDFLCRCTAADQCRDGSGTANCSGTGRCICGTTTCNAGERCQKTGPNQVCSCNGGAACVPGQVCCQNPTGCFDLQSDATNCGACGRKCPAGSTCVAGSCS
jgi:hypothetical protein